MLTIDILIKGGTVITETETFRADVAVTGERITAVGDLVRGKAAREIEAHNLLVLPGAIDVHVHMALPFGGTVSSDDFFTGSRAAACGGVTTMIDFARQVKGSSLRTAIEKRRAIADKDVCIDYSLHARVTDVNEETLAEIPQVIAGGIANFKACTAYPKEGLMLYQDELRLLMHEIARHRSHLNIHAEEGELIERNREELVVAGKRSIDYHPVSRPPQTEVRAISAVIAASRETGCPIYINHVSTAEGAAEIRRARAEGLLIYAETCPQYLLLSEECYHRLDGINYAVSPPLRGTGDQKVLWQAVSDGTIQVVSTDHCPFTCEQKELGRDDFTKVPNGMPGIETRLPLLYSEGVGKGRISLTRLVQLLSYNPAKFFGLYPRKGRIEVGSDADLVLFDPKRRVRISATQLHMNCDWSPYEGMVVTGWPLITLLRGAVIQQEGEFLGRPGQGQFIGRSLGGAYDV